MNQRENVLRAIRFEKPDYIPMHFHINAACWNSYDAGALQDLMEEHRFLFPDFKRQERVNPDYDLNARRHEPYLDPWGCLWETTQDGIVGTVRRRPLADWSAFDTYTSPDPGVTDGLFPVDWEALRAKALADRRAGRPVFGGLPHGHTFLRLQDIRGYENLLLDMMDGDWRLMRLIDMVADFNERCVSNWLQFQPDIMSYPEDLGMQVGPMLSPECFRRYIKPVYRRLMTPARARGCIVHMHSDGDVRTLVDDLLEGGVDMINVQDLVNGVDWIAGKLAGRVCVEIDIDRQQITPGGTADQVDALIREEVEKLGSARGGLLMIYGLYPGVPLENVKALMDAMEKYAGFYA